MAEAVPDAHEVLTPAMRYAAGGKRLRALLLLASHAAHGGTAATAAVPLAAALELFQTAALLHDDVLDGSDTRRGGPAAHREVEALHRTMGWHGDSAAFGAAGAILAGDLTLMACQRAVNRACAAAPRQAVVVADMFSDMADLVTAGQYADMRAAAQPLAALRHQEAQIRAVMRAKTASYSAEFPLALGAAVAGASDDAMSAMRSIGRDLGVAFQLRDDVLGLVGRPEVTGKPAGDDVREGKRTLLAWYAWSHGDGSTREAVALAFGDRDADDEAVASAVEAMVDAGAVEHAEQEIAHLTRAARSGLEAAGLSGIGASTLDTLITQAVDREH
ncbi:geranylgeranyl pyrophosphate synthase [Demequina litorisediminis]|uniref:Geranylgeranyl pyrophosphate synthase n=1 Tax=Demequina litorisediminis TaxID=1849022 RepID=A0ABQ6I910_9MICO|nr:geranylgeranyl pyrophosphate synthase [Demequina litorisediminis]